MLNYKTRHASTDHWSSAITEFRVAAHHDQGAEPYKTVNFEVYVAGRQSNEHFELTRADAIALRDMFAQVAATMQD